MAALVCEMHSPGVGLLDVARYRDPNAVITAPASAEFCDGYGSEGQIQAPGRGNVGGSDAPA
jgi:hypothetical protein